MDLSRRGYPVSWTIPLFGGIGCDISSGGASAYGDVSWVAPGIAIRREAEEASLDTPSEIVGGRRVPRPPCVFPAEKYRKPPRVPNYA